MLTTTAVIVQVRDWADLNTRNTRPELFRRATEKVIENPILLLETLEGMIKNPSEPQEELRTSIQIEPESLKAITLVAKMMMMSRSHVVRLTVRKALDDMWKQP